MSKRRVLLGPATVLSVAVLVVATSGCFIKSEKSGSNGKDENVTIKTPVGGLEVHENQTDAKDLGLVPYPGAAVVPDHDGDKSADVSMGFGKWRLKVKAVNYRSSDPPDKILAFYRTALGRYGDVIECQGDRSAGKPDHTREGLTCADAKGKGVNINIDDDRDNVSLKAGSKRHQHILGIRKATASGTNFTLVEVDLPAGLEDFQHRHGDDSDKSE